jgi:hypothetical protein
MENQGALQVQGSGSNKPVKVEEKKLEKLDKLTIMCKLLRPIST